MVKDLLVDVLAAHRLTRLVTADVLTQPIRDRWIHAAYVGAGRATLMVEGGDTTEEGVWQTVVDGDPEAPKLATLVTCRWCAGMYVAAGVVLARRLFPRQWGPLARVLAVSSASALLAAVEDH